MLAARWKLQISLAASSSIGVMMFKSPSSSSLTFGVKHD
jgi:hypothetical protein